jgi:hypothetical protein
MPLGSCEDGFALVAGVSFAVVPFRVAQDRPALGAQPAVKIQRIEVIDDVDGPVEIHVLPDVVRPGDGRGIGAVEVPIRVRVPRGERHRHAVAGVLHPFDHASVIGDQSRHIVPPVLGVVDPLLHGSV